MKFKVVRVAERMVQTPAGPLAGAEYYFQGLCGGAWGEDLVSLTIATTLPREFFPGEGEEKDSEGVVEEFSGFLPELTVARIVQPGQDEIPEGEFGQSQHPDHISYQLIGYNDDLALAIVVNSSRENLFELNSKVSSEEALKVIES